jgi:integrase
VRNKDPNTRIRELELELAKERAAADARAARFAAELEAVRRQATARRAPATVFVGRLTQSEVNRKIRNRELGSYFDGGNLSLDIRSGAKPDSEVIASWLFRWTETVRTGVYKGRSLGLRSARLVPLEDVRRKAQQFRELLADGKDPKIEQLGMLLEEQSAKDRLRTLEQVGEEYIAAKISGRSEGYKQRTWQLLRDQIFNKEHRLSNGQIIKVGTMPIQRVTQLIILKDCGFEEFWNTQYPSARDLRMHLHRMYGYARHKGYYIGDSQMAWRGSLEYVLKEPKDFYTVRHHRAVTYQTAPKFLQQHLRKHHYRRPWRVGVGPDGRPINAYMIELALLTATRVGEIISAEWQEIDQVTMTWTVPWEHTKRKEPGHPHRMPITRSMAAIFGLMQQIRTDASPQAPIFPSHHKRWAQSHRRVGSQTLMRVARQLSPELGQKFTNHGFRSTFKDWCKATGKPDAWYKEQVHHKEENKTEQAYGHDDLLEQRRAMMAQWDGYLNTAPPPAKEANNVVALSKRRTS